MEIHLGTIGLRQMAGGKSHCTIRQLKDTSAEDMSIPLITELLLFSLPWTITVDCLGFWDGEWLM